MKLDGAFPVPAPILKDGTNALNIDATDIGQGLDPVLAQFRAERLQVPFEMVSAASPDTDGSPHRRGNTTSRAVANALKQAVGAAPGGGPDLLLSSERVRDQLIGGEDAA